METINTIIRENKCSGCMICRSICPKHCISCQEEKDGFMYPIIQEDVCIKCGMCLKKCPIATCEGVLNPYIDSYSFYSYNNEIAMRSSTSGVFYEIASSIIDCGGVVCGAAFADDWEVEHILVFTKEELQKLTSSKYVQSSISVNVVSEIKRLLLNTTVLFVGTPCQVAAIKSFVGKSDNLFTVDFICHGVPSPLVWKKYLDDIAGGRIVTDVNFRDKRNESCYGLSVKFDDGTDYYKPVTDDSYLQGFINNLFIRKSCTACNFKGIKHTADITLGDLWNAERISGYYQGKKYISWVLVKSKRGEQLLETVKERFEVLPVPIDAANRFNMSFSESAAMHKKSCMFWKMINDEEIDVKRAIDYCIRKRWTRKLFDGLKKRIRYLGGKIL